MSDTIPVRVTIRPDEVLFVSRRERDNLRALGLLVPETAETPTETAVETSAETSGVTVSRDDTETVSPVLGETPTETAPETVEAVSPSPDLPAVGRKARSRRAEG